MNAGRYTISLWTLLLIGVLVFIVAKWYPMDATDDQAHKKRSGLSLYIDHGTGCHYISGPFGIGLRPRLDKDGNQICTKEEKQETR